MWFWWLLEGCAKRLPDPAVAIAAAAATSDRAWEDRATGGLDPVGAPLLEARNLYPGDPSLGWRLVRWRIAEGNAATEPTAARDAFAEGRTEMLTCLDGDPLFAQQRPGAGWGEALHQLSVVRRPCAAWGALAWVRWTTHLGPAATTLDLPAIDAIFTALDDDATVAEPLEWAQGLSLVLRPEWTGRDLPRGVQLLQRTAERDRESVLRRLDVYAATRDPALLDQLRKVTPQRPEDSGAWQVFVTTDAGLGP